MQMFEHNSSTTPYVLHAAFPGKLPLQMCWHANRAFELLSPRRLPRRTLRLQIPNIVLTPLLLLVRYWMLEYLASTA